MLSIRRRWQSIDHKLPLLASGLVLLTVVALGWTSYVLLERALIDATGRRLFSTALVVAQMVNRPTSRSTDSVGRAQDRAIVAYVDGNGSRAAALAALARLQTQADTAKIYGGFTDTVGRPLLAYHRPPKRAPVWPFDAIRDHAIRGDSVIIGPIERIDGKPAYSLVRALRDTVSANVRLVGYLIETRAILGRNIRMFRDIVGSSVQILVGEPGAGVWTDLETTVDRPPVTPVVGTFVNYADGVGAATRIGSTKWVVWLSQPKRVVLAPARTLLWSVIPIGLLIALVSAALMWRMARGITHPIVQLTAAAETIAAEGAVDSLVPTSAMTQEADE